MAVAEAGLEGGFEAFLSLFKPFYALEWLGIFYLWVLWFLGGTVCLLWSFL